MQTQTTQFAIESKNNVIETIGKSTIYQEKPGLKENSLKWYEDKLKKKAN